MSCFQLRGRWSKFYCARVSFAQTEHLQRGTACKEWNGSQLRPEKDFCQQLERDNRYSALATPAMTKRNCTGKAT